MYADARAKIQSAAFARLIARRALSAIAQFPFDCQDLTVTVLSQCALAGPVPCEFVVGERAHLGVDLATFPFGDEWGLSSRMKAEVVTLGGVAAQA